MWRRVGIAVGEHEHRQIPDVRWEMQIVSLCPGNDDESDAHLL